MKPQTTRLSAWLALLMTSSLVVSPTFLRADASGIGSPNLAANNAATTAPLLSGYSARVNKIQGEVSKRIAQGEILAQSSVCEVNDLLPEGSVIETKGKSSWAELKMGKNKEVTTRIWGDTVARIYPGARTVCVGSGAFLLKKNTDCSDEYVIETRRLQARIRGTTVRLHAMPERDEIQVLESHSFVEVWNKVNNSRVKLTPGVVMDVRGQIRSEDTRFNMHSMLPHKQPIAKNDEPEFRLNPKKGELIFKDKYSSTVVYTANSKTVFEHPMIAGRADLPAIESLNLIKQGMSKVPSSDNIFGNMIEEAFNAGKPDRHIVRNFKILSVPSKTAYYIGPNVGNDKSIHLPGLAYSADLAPAGVISAVSSSARVIANQKVAPVMNVMPAGFPYTENPAANPLTANVSTFVPQANTFTNTNFTPVTAVRPVTPPLTQIPQMQAPVPTQIASPAPLSPVTPVAPIIAPVTPFAPMQQFQVQPFNNSNITSNVNLPGSTQNQFSKADINIGRN